MNHAAAGRRHGVAVAPHPLVRQEVVLAAGPACQKQVPPASVNGARRVGSSWLIFSCNGASEESDDVPFTPFARLPRKRAAALDLEIRALQEA